MNHLQAWERFGKLTWSAIPEDIQQVAGQCVLDWFACAVAGSREPLSAILREEFGHRTGDASVIGTDVQLEPATAALVNGAAGHALDFDDTGLSVGCHSTAPVIPAVLALAESTGASGAELMAAFVAGVEIEGRVGNTFTVAHYAKGWHTTATYGVFGAAAGAAHLLGLDEEAFGRAMGLAASMACGVKANFGTMTKPFHAGHAAEQGLMAARLAARGLTANPEALSGNQGLVQAAGEDGPQTERLERLADRWLIRDTLFKYHAACHLTHAAIESVLRLRTKIPVDDLERVTLTVNPKLLDICGIPDPQTGLEGKFSLRGTSAMAWLGIDTSNAANFVDDVIGRADVQALIPKVRVEMDEALTTMQTRVQAVTTQGEGYDEYHDTGVPAEDLDEQGRKLDQKFLNLAAVVLEDSESRTLHRRVQTLTEVPDLKGWV